MPSPATMTSVAQVYDLEGEIAAFFAKTPVRREACDMLAKDLVGCGDDRVVPAPMQGSQSYTVYAGQHVVQFRPKSLPINLGTTDLARRIFSSLAPQVSFRQQLGADSTAEDGQEPLLVYVSSRLPGVTKIEFVLAHGSPENSPGNMARRKVFVEDIARFFALGWKTPQELDRESRDSMAEAYEKDLQDLLGALPGRFHPLIRATLASLPGILSLPTVLTHEDLGSFKLMIQGSSGHFSGALGWDEATIQPFGTNLEFIEDLMSKLHLTDGWVRYQDYNDLAALFWQTFTSEVGRLDRDTIRAIDAARVLGLLRRRGFTSRSKGLGFPDPAVPIRIDSDQGRYNLMILDGLLLDPATRLEALDVLLEQGATSRSAGCAVLN